MPSPVTAQFPKPQDDVEFQEMIRDIFSTHWRDDGAIVYGRSGQKQFGVDVFGNPNKSKLNYGIQCKVRKGEKLTKKEIENEINEAKKFKPQLDTYIIITTSDRDSKLQSIVKKLNDGQKKDFFEVQIMFWEDVSLLLAEHPHLIRKYYSGFLDAIESAMVSIAQKPIHQIDNSHPLLVGCLFDLSRQMVVQTMAKLNKPIGFDYLIKELVFRVSAFCKDEQMGVIRNNFYLFAYGFGFGDVKKNVISLFEDFGVKMPSESKGLNITGNVRNLFQEVSLSQSLPVVPNIAILNHCWSYYERSVRNQFLDIGSGRSNLNDGLVSMLEEFHIQLERSFYPHPILLLISDGKTEDHSEKIAEIANKIKKQGIQIVSLIVAQQDFLNNYTMYGEVDLKWPEEFKLLFDISSEFDEKVKFNSQMLEKAKKGEWTIQTHPKLFFQINQTEMIDEIIELMFGSLRNDG